MGNQQQPWMFAEDRFGRRLRLERERRGMTQADVAHALDERLGLKLHPSAVAKMEQRDVERPRAIRLFEAQALAELFGLEVDEMLSDGDSEIEKLAKEFTQLSAEADALRSQTVALFDKMRGLASIMAIPAGQVTPSIQVSRDRIIQALAGVAQTEESGRRNAATLLDQVLLETGRSLIDSSGSTPEQDTYDRPALPVRPGRLESWYDGVLDNQMSDRVKLHVSRCQRCQEVIDSSGLHPSVAEFAEALREVVRDQRWTASTLARGSQYSKQQWGEFLSGETLPPEDVIEAMPVVSRDHLMALWAGARKHQLAVKANVNSTMAGVTIGMKLKQARRDLGLTLEEVSAKTRIKINLLVAMEQGDFLPIEEAQRSLPAGPSRPSLVPVYIRTFARAVELNPQDLVDEYEDVATSGLSVDY